MTKKIMKIMFVVLILVFSFMYLVNRFLITPYTFYRAKQSLKVVHEKIEDYSYQEYLENREAISNKHKVITVGFDFSYENEIFNGAMNDALKDQRIILNRLWLSDTSFEELIQKETLFKLHNQGVLGYSFSVLYVIKGTHVIIIGKSVPHTGLVISAYEELNIIIWIATFAILMFIGYVLSIKWTKPIYVLNEKAYKMSRLEFKPAVIKTGDELEELANSINNMSDQLEKALTELEHKKKSLETLLSDVSHELKTPISSINLYAHGIEDGLDDGTYFKGLYDNIDKIDRMILQLLNHSKITQMTLAKEDIDCVVLVNDILSELDILLSRKKLVLDLPDSMMIKGDYDQLRIAIKNLIVNACNYSDNEIVIQLNEKLMIKNDVASFDKKKLPFLMDPFYVTDESRSGEQSGTGLGLFIVKNIMDKHEFDFSIDVIHNEFIVLIDFINDETF